MFEGKFKIGGKSHISEKKIHLYRISPNNSELLDEFINSIQIGVMAWDGVNKNLIYVDEDGSIYKAQFTKTGTKNN